MIDGRAARRTLFACGIALRFCTLWLGQPAWAHAPFQITTDARVRNDRLDVRIAMSMTTAALLCPTTTSDASVSGPAAAAMKGKQEPAAFTVLRARVEACAPGLYDVTSAGTPLRPNEARVFFSPPYDVDIALVYPRPLVGPLRFDAVHLKRLGDPLFGATLVVTGGERLLGQALLRAKESTLVIPISGVAEHGGGTTAGAPEEATRPHPTFAAYLRLGFEHILTGTDHLLFLAGLLVACRRFRTILTIVSCFTVAHSLTLGLAALNVVALSGRVVEPLIAASIVFVGVENLLRGEEPPGRWALTFTFGLLHGFGFAGALKQIGLGAPGTSIVLPLFSFNLGVELGQVAVASAFLPVLWKLRTWPWFARHGTRVVSLVVAALGSYWMFQRLLFAA